MVNNHGDRMSPKDGVVGPLPNGRTPWLINGGPDPNHLLTRPGSPSSKYPPRVSMQHILGGAKNVEG